MLLIAENIPATSETVPLIGIYLTVTMSLTSLSIILTVLVLQLHYTGSFAPDISESLYDFMTKKIATRIGMSETVKRYEAKRSLMLKKRENLKLNGAHSISIENHKSDTKLTQIESSLVDCRKNINTIRNDLKQINENQASFKRRNMPTNMSQRVLKRNRSKQTQQTSKDQLSKLTLQNETSTKNIEIQKENSQNSNEHVINLKIETDAYSKRLPINDLNHFYNNNIYEIKQMNGHVTNSDNFIFKNTNSIKTNNQIEDCVKKIDIFSSNLQRYLDLHEVEELNNHKKNEWKLIASIIDRFLFWIFLVMTFVSTVMLLIIIPYLKNNHFYSLFQNLKYLKKSED